MTATEFFSTIGVLTTMVGILWIGVMLGPPMDRALQYLLRLEDEALRKRQNKEFNP